MIDWPTWVALPICIGVPLAVWLVSLIVTVRKQEKEIKRLQEWVTRLEGTDYFAKD